jgi:hypothetical protein
VRGQYYKLSHLADALCLRANALLIALDAYTVYFDESGSHDQSRMFIVAGWAASVEQWKHFEKHWRAILTDENAEYFHMKEFAPSVGQFEGWKGDEPRRRAFLRSLLLTIKVRVRVGVSCGVSMEAWNKVNVEYPLAEHGLWPYVLAGWGCVQRIDEWKNARLGRDDTVAAIFERGAKHRGALMRRLEKEFNCTPILGEKKRIGALQAADFAAWEFHKIGSKMDLSSEDALQESVRAAVAARKLRIPLREIAKIHQGQSLFLEKDIRKLCGEEGLRPRLR